MSLKNTFCFAALLALVATPAMAQSLRVENAGLDGSGDWIWEVYYDTDADGGAASVEFGASFSDADVMAGTVTTTGEDNGDVEQATVGQVVFGWETLTDGDLGAFPVGLQVDPSQGSNGQAFYAYGTGVLAGSSSLLLGSFTTDGPSTAGSLTTSIDLLGAYDGSADVVGSLPGTHGLVGESDGKTAVNASGSRTAIPGDTNLSWNGSGVAVTGADLATLANNFGKPGPFTWADGDFNGSGTVTGADLADLANNFGKTFPAPGAVAATGTPEPTSVSLALLLAGSLAAYRRR